MLERGFLPDFAPEVMAELSRVLSRPPAAAQGTDLRGLLWSSIDNDDSLDLDQIEVAEDAGDGAVRVKVGIADVDGSVRASGTLDGHAAHNTTSVYAGVTVFTMLPPALSYDATSLKQDTDRQAIVISFRVLPDGTVDQERVERGLVRNKAKLAYSGLGEWLSGRAALPVRVQAVPGLQAQLELQARATQALRDRRVQQGALDLETIEARPVLSDGEVVDLELLQESRSRQLIEDLMVASNGVMARFLAAHQRSSIARVVKVPKRWERIVELAGTLGTQLPASPDPVALERFLLKQRASDPVRFPDLSLAVVKLLGPGEYDLQRPGAARVGPLRAGCPGLHPFHCSQPEVRRPRHPAAGEGGARRRAVALRRVRAAGRGRPLHADGGRGETGGTPGAEDGGGAAAAAAHRPSLRRDCHRRLGPGDLRPAAVAPSGGPGGARRAGDGRR